MLRDLEITIYKEVLILEFVF